MKKITVSILTTLLMLSMVFSSSVFAANEEKASAWDSFLGLFSAKTATTSDVGVEYRGHIQNVGNYPLDGSWIQGPTRLGTVGQSLRLEGFWIQLTNKPADVNIQYQVHVQNVGWMNPVENGAFAGTEGKSQQIEAIKISLVDDNGNPVSGYSVEYRGHVQNIGDTAWYKDGAQLGTDGQFLRLEALEVKIVQTKADMTAYNAAVAAAGALTEADYTADSWAVLETALANVVTEDNTQAEVDAATAAINDAIDNLVMVTNVTGVSATDAKTLTVTFNTAISAEDQAKTTFVVKRGTTPTTMLAPVWATDGKSVKLARSTNLLAGTYTVTVGGIDLGTNVATTDVEAQKIAKLEITTSNVIVDATAKVNYTVLDQYGQEFPKNANTFNWTVVNTTASSRTVAATAGAVKFVTLDTAATPAQIGDVLRVTGLLVSDPSVVVTKDITVSNIYTDSFAFGEVVLPEGADRLMQNAGYVELGYTAADNLGADVIFTDKAANISNEFNNIQFFSSDADVIPVTGANGFKVVDGKLYVKVLNDSGDATITALNVNTGATTTKKITVYGEAVPTTVEFGAFKDQEIISGDAAGTAKLGITFFDQYGSAIDNDTYNMTTEFNVTVTGIGATPLDPADALTGGYMTFNDNLVTPGTYTVTLLNKITGVSNNVQLVVNEARVPNQLTVVTAPQATIVDGLTTTPKFKVLDQYGVEVTNNAAYEIVVTTESGNENTLDITTPVAISSSITNVITGAAAGTDTVVYTLQKKVGPVDIDSQAFAITVIADVDAFTATTDKTEYTAGQDIAVTVRAQKGGAFYNKYNETETAVVTLNGKAYNRTLSFVNGVANTTIPATIVSDDEAVNVAFTSQGGLGVNINTATIDVIAAAATKFVLTGTTGAATLDVSLQDNYGNVIDMDGNKIVTVTFPTAMNANKPVGIGADGTLVTAFTDGEATITFADDLTVGTYTVTFGSYTGTLTLE